MISGESLPVVLFAMAALFGSVILVGEFLEFVAAREVHLFRRLRIARPQRYTRRELLLAAPVWVVVAVFLIGAQLLVVGMVLDPDRVVLERAVAAIELALVTTWLAYLARLKPSKPADGQQAR